MEREKTPLRGKRKADGLVSAFAVKYADRGKSRTGPRGGGGARLTTRCCAHAGGKPVSGSRYCGGAGNVRAYSATGIAGCALADDNLAARTSRPLTDGYWNPTRALPVSGTCEQTRRHSLHGLDAGTVGHKRKAFVHNITPRGGQSKRGDKTKRRTMNHHQRLRPIRAWVRYAPH